MPKLDPNNRKEEHNSGLSHGVRKPTCWAIIAALQDMHWEEMDLGTIVQNWDQPLEYRMPNDCLHFLFIITQNPAAWNSSTRTLLLNSTLYKNTCFLILLWQISTTSTITSGLQNVHFLSPVLKMESLERMDGTMLFLCREESISGPFPACTDYLHFFS